MRKRRGIRNAALRALCVLALAAAFYAALRLAGIYAAVHSERALRGALGEAARAAALPGDEAGPADKGALCAVDFDALRALCPDAVAWLSGCGGALETPIVQGSDNEFYLTHLPDGTPNFLGAAFLDARARAAFSDDQSLVYGHHMDTGGGVFAPLLEYSDAAFARRNPSFTLHTPDGCYTAEVFAAFSVSADEYVRAVEFAGADEWLAWIDWARGRSDVSFSVSPTPADRVLTLCTCVSKHGDGGARYVVCAFFNPCRQACSDIKSAAR